jgi:diacylglycerol diphosphate phosphatase / phosphatidate phosphatase
MSSTSWLSLAFQFAVAIVIATLSLPASILPSRAQFFLERDPALSHPFTNPPTCPNFLLALICLPLPLFGLLLLAFILDASAVNLKQKLISFLWLSASLLQALALASSATNIVKALVGRERPNFYAQCDYAGAREAFESGNFSAYLSSTNPSAVGDLSRCHASASDVMDAHRSFPSGHSSLSFAGLGFLFFALRHHFNAPSDNYFSLSTLGCGLPLILATWVALSRLWDYAHFYDDVFAGSSLGLLSAFLAFRHFTHLRTARQGGVLDEDGELLLPEAPATYLAAGVPQV